MSDKGLDANEMLGHEFDYAAQSANQANEDRARLYEYYLALLGVVAAAFLADADRQGHALIFGLLFLGLSFQGLMSLLKLARLRLAWVESVRAMCQIKAYYVERCPEMELGKALRWTAQTIPPAGKRWTVAFLMALTLNLLGSVSLCGAVLLLLRAATGELHPLWAAAAGMLALVTQTWLWERLVREKARAA
jgi:hypothetical protein